MWPQTLEINKSFVVCLTSDAGYKTALKVVENDSVKQKKSKIEAAEW